MIAAVPRGIKDRLRQDQTIGHDHRHIGLKRRKLRLRLGGLQRCRMAHRNAQRLSPRLHRRGLFLFAASCGAGRLGIGANDLVARSDQGLKRSNREDRGSHENDTHRPS
jgi:hypothetical protein